MHTYHPNTFDDLKQLASSAHQLFGAPPKNVSELWNTFSQAFQEFIPKEEFIEQEIEKADRFLSPFALSTLTLIGVMLSGIIYSFILVFLRMKLLPRLIRK